MDALDMCSARPGVVRIGAARIIRMDSQIGTGDDARLPVTLESEHGEIAARAPARLAARAGVSEGDTVVAAGVVEWIGEALVLDLQMLRRVEAQGATALAIWDVDPTDEIHLELPVPCAAYVLWLMCRDLARWAPGRRSRLSRDEAAGLALFLHDRLPRDHRTPLPAAPAKQRVA